MALLLIHIILDEKLKLVGNMSNFYRSNVPIKLNMTLLVLILIACTVAEKTFFDTGNTFARYRSWVVRDKGILLFNFSTYKENALLLYTDGGPDGSKDFLKVQLVNQKMVVHTNFGSGTEIFEIGEGHVKGNKV